MSDNQSLADQLINKLALTHDDDLYQERAGIRLIRNGARNPLPQMIADVRPQLYVRLSNNGS